MRASDRQIITVGIGAAMSFTDIARRLGYGEGDAARKTVFMTYVSAMRKIRNRPESTKAPRELIAFRDAARRGNA